MKCDKDLDCPNRPEWRVSFTNDFFGEGQTHHKLNYCNQCYNKVNPEHKRIVILNLGDMEMNGMLQEIRNMGYPEAVLDPNAPVNHTVILKFRRLIR